MRTVVIDARYCGPPTSANGGYASGLVASSLPDAPAVEVTLRAPPPLDTPLELDEGRLLHGDTLVAVAEPVELDTAVPEPVGLAEAEAAAAHYQWRGAEHPFPTCYVCGPEADGLDIFPGAVSGRDVFAAPWTPWTDDPIITWAALDCPTAFPLMDPRDERIAVLGRLAVRIEARPVPDEPHVVMSWALGREGRKSYGGAALLTADADVLAVARATWIELA